MRDLRDYVCNGMSRYSAMKEEMSLGEGNLTCGDINLD